MALEARLVQKLSQSLTMTPQLQQAIKLLQLGRLEYKEAIERELLENPLLEEMPGEESQSESAPTNSLESQSNSNISNDGGNGSEDNSSNDTPRDDAWDAYVENLTDSRDYATPKGLIDNENRPSLESTATRGVSLQEYLLDQLRLVETTDADKRILAHIIGNLDNDGYLTCEHEELCEACGCTVDELTAALEVLRSFEPVGVGARNLKECLLIQLDSLGLCDKLAADIVRNHLDKLERKKFDAIAKVEGCTMQDIAGAISIIQRLEPRPGRSFSDESPRYIEPDIYVQKMNGEYVVSLNDDGVPRLRINPYYADMLRDGDKDPTGQRAYISERVKAASWLIKSIHQRQQTIYRVAQSIVKYQTEFLDHGIERLKPLVLKEVADDIGIHESTVSRVTSNKYIHTPQGVFELKFFFTNGLKNVSGDSMSSSSIKERIKQLISGEDPNAPLSDQELVEALKKEQIDIARRTVAKYREGLGIESSSLRKRRL